MATEITVREKKIQNVPFEGEERRVNGEE